MSARGVPAEQTMRFVIGFALVSLAVPVLFPGSFWLVFAAFCCFELCCGVYFPCQGILRSRYIAEDTRTGVMNLFRVPLNAIVVLVLTRAKDLGNQSVFAICAVALLAAAACQSLLIADPRAKASEYEMVDVRAEEEAGEHAV